jgi:hypothetical protein
MYYPRRETSCLLIIQADKISEESYYNGKGNALIVATLEEF